MQKLGSLLCMRLLNIRVQRLDNGDYLTLLARHATSCRAIPHPAPTLRRSWRRAQHTGMELLQTCSATSNGWLIQLKLTTTKMHRIIRNKVVNQSDFKSSTTIRRLLSLSSCSNAVKMEITNLFLKFLKFWRCSEWRQVWIIKYGTKFEIVVPQSCP